MIWVGKVIYRLNIIRQAARRHVKLDAQIGGAPCKKKLLLSVLVGHFCAVRGRELRCKFDIGQVVV